MDIGFQAILDKIASDVRPFLHKGDIASYIPPLADIPREQFGIALRTVSGDMYRAGDASIPFSVQSIAKIISLTVAIDLVGESIWDRVGREPSGTPFNSLVQLESEHGIPRNPMINAGALVLLDIIMSNSENARALLASFVDNLCSGQVNFDKVVGDAEKATSFRNRALANYLKSFNNLDNEPDDVVDLHCELSSLSLNCVQLCQTFSFLASGGIATDGSRIATPEQVKRINALLLTCGVYDEAGEYAFRVGLPAKSGVGGGVVAVMPGDYVVCVWSPALNSSGNSYCGTYALELLTTRTSTSIFGGLYNSALRSQ